MRHVGVGVVQQPCAIEYLNPQPPRVRAAVPIQLALQDAAGEHSPLSVRKPSLTESNSGRPTPAKAPAALDEALLAVEEALTAKREHKGKKPAMKRPAVAASVDEEPPANDVEPKKKQKKVAASC